MVRYPLPINDEVSVSITEKGELIMTSQIGIWIAIGCAVGEYLIIAFIIYCHDRGYEKGSSLFFSIFWLPVVIVATLVIIFLLIVSFCKKWINHR